MADQTETVTAEAVVTTATNEPQETTPGKTLDEVKAENERLAKALKEANKEAAARRIKLDEFEKAEEARKNAELSEVERLKKESETHRLAAEAAKREVLQRDIAAEVGLPAVLAGRLQGADREAMLADAKAMLEALPKAKPPTGSATNPAGAQVPTETVEQKRRRLGIG